MSQEKTLLMTEPSGLLMPLAFRWFARHGLLRFKPWILGYDTTPNYNVRREFQIESDYKRDIIPFAFRQDNDDVAGFEVIEGQITDHVIVFHPAWSQKPETNLIDAEFVNLWDFVSKQVIDDMKDWASEDELPVT